MEKNTLSQTTSNTGSLATQKVTDFARKSGDAIESIGDRLEHSGFKKTGDAVEKFGDTIEHFGDRRKGNNSKKMNTDLSMNNEKNEATTSFFSDAYAMARRQPLAVVAGVLAVGYVASRLFIARNDG